MYKRFAVQIFFCIEIAMCYAILFAIMHNSYAQSATISHTPAVLLPIDIRDVFFIRSIEAF